MPVPKPLAVLGSVLVFALPIAALQPPAMTEEDYGTTMTAIGASVGDANQHIDSGYWPDLQEDMQKIRRRLDTVEQFWTTRGTTAAVKLAQSAIQGVRSVQAAADTQDDQATRTALRDLEARCQSCHEQFREETADGFRIKKQ